MDIKDQTIKARSATFLRLNNYLQQLLRRAEVDRAVSFGVLAKIWGIGAGPVTAILIAIKFTQELQGYYYTFATLLALQVFVELGLGTVIIQFASHEWSQLDMDKSGQIIGDRNALSRLASLAGVASKWYTIGGIIAILGLGVGGYIFFSGSPDSNVNWVAPWFLLCLLTGIDICLVPIWSLLEGCNQVASLYTYRFIQGVLTSLSVWIAILSGAGLWTVLVASTVSLFCAFVFLRSRYWIFLKTLLFSKTTGPRISWRIDILPMQWRIALSWISGYFVFSLFTPVLFKFHGPVVAGQMGMTWSLIGAIGAISTSWISPKVPRFGMLIAQRKYKELDHLFWRVTKIVMGITLLIAFAVWVLVYMLNTLDFHLAKRLAARLLPPLPTGLFLLAQVFLISSIPFSSYLRAHKKEPLMFLSVLAGILTGLSTLILGKYYSATGMAIGYLSINMLLIPFVFLTWYRCRAAWHAPVNVQ
jgi:O-antigen/teichoic acid export membrane protein